RRERLADGIDRRDARELDIGVKQQSSNELRSAVTGAANHRGFEAFHAGEASTPNSVDACRTLEYEHLFARTWCAASKHDDPHRHCRSRRFPPGRSRRPAEERPLE